MKIYFFNTKKLANELALDRISEIDAFGYFLANTVLLTLNQYYSYFLGAIANWMFLYEIVVVLIISIFGVYKCFEANGGEKGSNFLLRAICLSFPISIEINIFSIAFGWSLYFGHEKIFDPLIFRDPTSTYDLIVFISSAIFVGLFYYLLRRHLLAISNFSAPNKAPNQDAP